MKKTLLQTVLLLILGVLMNANINAQTNYNLWIAGVQVTSDNATDLSTIDGVAGTVIYDHASKTLTIKNATIKGGDIEYRKAMVSVAIYSKIKDLTINLTGNNNLEECNVGLDSYENLNIKGPGTLTVTADTDMGFGIGILHETIIENCTIDVEGSFSGIIGDTNNTNLTVRNATIKARCGFTEPGGSIIGIVNLTLDGCAITAPEGAAFDENLEGIALNQTLVTEQVVIEPSVGIQETEIIKDIAIYPSPVNDVLHIELSENNFGVELYNMFGQQVSKVQNERDIPVSKLSSGIYILKITTEKGIYSRKIVKE